MRSITKDCSGTIEATIVRKCARERERERERDGVRKMLDEYFFFELFFFILHHQA